MRGAWESTPPDATSKSSFMLSTIVWPEISGERISNRVLLLNALERSGKLLVLQVGQP